MFERYTEKARRVIFFARYEASQYGSTVIDPEHILLGLLREDKSLPKWVPKTDVETIRQRIVTGIQVHPSIATSVDLPLSAASQKVLKQAATEADRLNHRYTGTQHLFLAILEGSTPAGKLLADFEINITKLRKEFAAEPPQKPWFPFVRDSHVAPRIPSVPTLEIHGARRNTEYIRDVVNTVRSYNWHWHKTAWKPRDIVIHRKEGTFSFELKLAEDTENFTLVKEGWKKDRCFVCGWQLFESNDDHGVGYTNGRTWLCVECCERFVLGDYFTSSHSEMT
jgi:hypothetical protein